MITYKKESLSPDVEFLLFPGLLPHPIFFCFGVVAPFLVISPALPGFFCLEYSMHFF